MKKWRQVARLSHINICLSSLLQCGFVGVFIKNAEIHMSVFTLSYLSTFLADINEGICHAKYEIAFESK